MEHVITNGFAITHPALSVCFAFLGPKGRNQYAIVRRIFSCDSTNHAYIRHFLWAENTDLRPLRAIELMSGRHNGNGRLSRDSLFYIYGIPFIVHRPSTVFRVARGARQNSFQRPFFLPPALRKHCGEWPVL